MITPEQVNSHFSRIGALPLQAMATDSNDNAVAIQYVFQTVLHMMQGAHFNSHKTILIGNGGSAAIASHMAIDFTKNGKLRAITFNDASLLTCLSNDFGYENALAKAVEYYADQGDFLIAISSSGESTNIINACQAAQEKCHICTFSGFKPDNALRRMGDVNFYVPADDYGSVEVTHLALLHGMLDLYVGVGT